MFYRSILSLVLLLIGNSQFVKNNYYFLIKERILCSFLNFKIFNNLCEKQKRTCAIKLNI